MKIVIIAAMVEELDYIIKSTNAEKIDSLNSQDVYSYKGKNEFIFLTAGIGKVSATFTTSLVTAKYTPDLIVSIGTSGAISQEINIGDFVIGNKLGFWDVDVTAFDYDLGQLPNEETYFQIENVDKIIDIVKSANINYEVGTILTGDSFVCRDSQLDIIKNNFDKPMVVEMESAAIVYTAKKLNVDVFVVRTVSDNANGDSGVDFKDYIDIVSKEFYKLVEAIDENY